MNKPRVFASADWHGCGELADKVFKFLKPDDILYFLGDSIDRGPDGVKIFQKLISDPRVHYIKGNHDEMMRELLPYLYAEKTDINAYHGNKYGLWFGNGGHVTAQDLMSNYTPEEICLFKKALDEMPTKLTYKSPAGHTVIMEHAGYTPFDIPHRSHDPLWDREHFYDRWASGCGASETARDTYLIHGHTPVQYLKFMYGYNGEQPLTKEEMIAKRQFMQDIIMDGEEIIKPTIIRYCNGHKFDIDMCTVASNRIALLDLDTFEEIYFDKEEEN